MERAARWLKDQWWGPGEYGCYLVDCLGAPRYYRSQDGDFIYRIVDQSGQAVDSGYAMKPGNSLIALEDDPTMPVTAREMFRRSYERWQTEKMKLN